MENKEKIDTMLEELKIEVPENTFPATDEFKAEFYKKAEAQDAGRRRFRKIRQIAAVAVAAAGFTFVYANQDHILDWHTDAPVTLKVNQTNKLMPAQAKDECEEQAPQEEISKISFEETPGLMKRPKHMPAMIYYNAVANVSGFSSSGERTYAAKKMKSYRKADVMPPPSVPEAVFNTEEYKGVDENPFLSAAEQSLSTFGADVDTAGYANVRRFLTQENMLPPKDAVRIEEFVNYFRYDYAAPQGDDKFSATFEMTDAPWKKDHKLLLVGLQAKNVELDKLPASSFVFLVDNSGSMMDSMDLVIESMTMLAKQMRDKDTISLVTYGGGVRTLLDGVSGKDKENIIAKLKELRAGGYTPGSAGIQTAYQLAKKHFIRQGNNRIVLITDGDFNVGTSSESELIELVEKERRSGVYLSVFGAGMGNYKDNKLKMLANKGNGNYGYLDNLREAKNRLVNEFSGGMFALAKDVKLQLEFNPAKVHSYRLLGYELRKMANRDFRDDTKDSGEVGIGHQVTALYELVMADAADSVKKEAIPSAQELKYQKNAPNGSSELLTFRLRYQETEGNAPAAEKEFILKQIPECTANLRWAACAAEFALLLRNSPYKGTADYEVLRKRAVKWIGNDDRGDRAEFLTLVRAAGDLKK